MSAHDHSIVPAYTGSGKGAGDGGQRGEDVQVLRPEPLSQKACDAEETWVPGGEYDYRTVGVFYML